MTVISTDGVNRASLRNILDAYIERCRVNAGEYLEVDLSLSPAVFDQQVALLGLKLGEYLLEERALDSEQLREAHLTAETFVDFGHQKRCSPDGVVLEPVDISFEGNEFRISPMLEGLEGLKTALEMSGKSLDEKDYAQLRLNMIYLEVLLACRQLHAGATVTVELALSRIVDASRFEPES